jgi:hypothetical protein
MIPDAVSAAELAEAEIRYRHQLARETGAREYVRGLADGYLRAVADIKALQAGMVLDAELEGLRWGPGGRAHFGDLRPGDFLGREREAEAELSVTSGDSSSGGFSCPISMLNAAIRHTLV